MALSDFEKYVASKGGNTADIYLKPEWRDTNVGANVGNKLPSVMTPSDGELRAPGLGVAGGIANPTTTGSAWEQGKNQASQTVAGASGKDYVPYVEQQLAQAQTTLATPTVPTTPTNAPPAVQTTPTTPITPTGSTEPSPGVPNTGLGGMGGGMGAAENGGSKLPTATDMSEYIRELYDAQKEQNLEALSTSYEQALAAVDAEKAALPQTYYEAGRQQQGQNALERMAMNERFAASGLGSGTSGQAALAQSMADQNEMGAIRRAEAKALADVEARRSALTAEYQGKVREAILQNNTQLANALLQEAQRVDASLVETALMQAELDAQAEQRAYERDYTKEQNNLEALTAKAKLLASAGDFSGYKALGYTDDEIAVLKGYWDAENAPKVYSGGGGDTSPTLPQTNMTLSTAKQLAESGYFSDEVLSVLSANGFDAGALESLYGYTGEQTQPTAPPTGYDTTQNANGVAPSEWAYVKNNILTNIRAGNNAAIDKYMSMTEGKMSDAQWAEIKPYLEEYYATGG